MTDGALRDCVILVAEDEYYIADDLRRELVRAGAIVIGPVPSLKETMRLIESTARIDGAILDLNLCGEMVFAAADLLRTRGVPFVFATGYDRMAIPSRFDDVARCEKPVAPSAVVKSLRANLAQPEQPSVLPPI